jgi:membrane-associated phospholipid phosphatase
MAGLSFVLLAWWVLSGRSAPFDLWLRAAIHSWASLSLTRSMMAVTTLGSEWFVVPMAGLLSWRLSALGRRREAIWFPAFSLSAELICQLLKLAIHRPRPEVFFQLSIAKTYSFPSGHAFISAVFYGLVTSILIAGPRSRRWRVAAPTLAGAVILLIGCSRVYLGYHYPSDVMGGWACAAAWLSVAGLTLARAQKNTAGQTHEEKA